MADRSDCRGTRIEGSERARSKACSLALSTARRPGPLTGKGPALSAPARPSGAWVGSDARARGQRAVHPGSKRRPPSGRRGRHDRQRWRQTRPVAAPVRRAGDGLRGRSDHLSSPDPGGPQRTPQPRPWGDTGPAPWSGRHRDRLDPARWTMWCMGCGPICQHPHARASRRSENVLPSALGRRWWSGGSSDQDLATLPPRHPVRQATRAVVLGRPRSAEPAVLRCPTCMGPITEGATVCRWCRIACRTPAVW
jgi:hypothetical protein